MITIELIVNKIDLSFKIKLNRIEDDIEWRETNRKDGSTVVLNCLFNLIDCSNNMSKCKLPTLITIQYNLNSMVIRKLEQTEFLYWLCLSGNASDTLCFTIFKYSL